MKTTRRPSTKIELYHCPICGEDYSVTYKRCPFCEERSAPRASSGGKRLLDAKGGGSLTMRAVGKIVSFLIILTAAGILFNVVSGLIKNGEARPLPQAKPSFSTPEPSPVAPEVPPVSLEPPSEPIPVPPEIPDTPPPSEVQSTASSFTLNRSDITLNASSPPFALNVRFLPAGTSGPVVWTSSNPSVVSVSSDGLVTALAKGSATITADISGYRQTCIVRCNLPASSGAQSDAQAAAPPRAPGAAYLNNTDFTLRKEGETTRLRIVGGSGDAPVWKTSNNSVATVSSDGTVTAVGKGICTITATANGLTLKAIARVNFG